MRITDNMRYWAASTSQARIDEDLYGATKRASSGLKVDAPSDDPSTYASITVQTAELDRLNARKGSLDATIGDAQLAESSLASASDVLVRAREIAVDMASGDKGASDRAEAAKEIDGLRDQLLGLANAKGARGYVFGGTATATQPFTAAGVFQGNDNAVNIEIADNVTTRSNASGAKAFTAAGGRDVFADLAALSAALSSNNVAGVQGALDPLDQDHRQIVAARGDAGLTAEKLQSAGDVAGSAIVTVTQARARDQEVDATAAFSDLTRAQGAYQRNIQVTMQILQLSAFKSG